MQLLQRLELEYKSEPKLFLEHFSVNMKKHLVGFEICRRGCQANGMTLFRSDQEICQVMQGRSHGVVAYANVALLILTGTWYGLQKKKPIDLCSAFSEREALCNRPDSVDLPEHATSILSTVHTTVAITHLSRIALSFKSCISLLLQARSLCF